MFFYWLLDNGPTFAAKILASTLQLAADASQMKGAGWTDFLNLGVQILIKTVARVPCGTRCNQPFCALSGY